MYIHKDPTVEDETIVYVGKGCGGRAWDVTRNRNGHPEHQKWMTSLMDEGYIPSDWVEVLARGMTEQEAFTMETTFLHKHGTTIFNRQSGERNNKAKLTDVQAREIYTACLNGEPHKSLALSYGVSRSAISMIASRKQWRATTA